MSRKIMFGSLLLVGLLLFGCLGSGTSTTPTTAPAVSTTPTTALQLPGVMTVLDASTNQPIAGALIDYNDSQLGEQQDYTQSDGTATLLMEDPSVMAAISAQGYSEEDLEIANGANVTVYLNESTAATNSTTGQNPSATVVTVLDNSTLQPVAGALVDYNDSQLGEEQEYTQSDGTAVLPMQDPSVEVAVTASGYNETDQVVDNGVNATIYLVESGGMNSTG